MTKKNIFYAFVLNGEIFTPAEYIIKKDGIHTSDQKNFLSAKYLMSHLAQLRQNAQRSHSESDHNLLMFFLRSALRAFPQDGRFWHFAGKMAEENGHIQEALALFERGLNFDSNDSYLLMSAAQAAFELGHDTQARNHITHLIELKPRDVVALGLATEVELALGNFPAAQHYAQRKLALDENNPVALGQATQVELALGNFPAARQYAQRNLALDENNPVALGLATQVELALGNFPAARQYAQRNLALDENNPLTLGLAVKIEMASGDAAGALNILARLPVAVRRANKILTYLEAKAYLLKGEIGSTLRIVTPLIKDHPDRAFTTLYMACMETADDIRVLEPLLGKEVFDIMWENSRDLRNKTGQIDETEKALFYGHNFWDSAPTRAINRSALLQMGGVPHFIRRSLETYEF